MLGTVQGNMDIEEIKQPKLTLGPANQAYYVI